VTGLPANGERGVSVPPVGEHAVIISEPMCSSCRPPAPEVYGIWRHSTTAMRLGTAREVVAARDGRAVWLLSDQTTTSCTLRTRLGFPAADLLAATRHWQHLPDLPASDVAAKATDMIWTGDGRLVVLTATATRGRVVAVWRPGQPRLALRQLTLPIPSPGTNTLAIW